MPLAYIHWLTGGGERPDHSLPGPQPPAGAHPAHPIVIPGVPPGSPGSPQHPIYLPVYPDNALPGPPLGTWGGVAPPYVDAGLPAPPLGTWGGGNVPMPVPPIYIPGAPPGSPGSPEHPIYLPPYIDNTLPPSTVLPLPPDEAGKPPTQALVSVTVRGYGTVGFLVDIPVHVWPVPPVAQPKK